MTIHVHIEQVMVEGVPVDPSEAQALRDAVKRGVGEQVAAGGPVGRGGRTAVGRSTPVELSEGDPAATVGHQVGIRVGEAVRR